MDQIFNPGYLIKNGNILATSSTKNWTCSLGELKNSKPSPIFENDGLIFVPSQSQIQKQ